MLRNQIIKETHTRTTGHQRFNNTVPQHNYGTPKPRTHKYTNTYLRIGTSTNSAKLTLESISTAPSCLQRVLTATMTKRQSVPPQI
ncbi:hypothetical protein, unlikely [Trypanosoma brucei brucei TREU927]|uniref:Uncharacterized protein n=1 Tax=Trypanosoma brucei brucei (strain 927/4 GUTat10.1) TaxID=185431 RepID=Q4GYT5_TRYB2|nr:hypothetical protein, unlikely [Trypanosoma brucei brucei TREU927]CAJ16466.1 hypothetical protein, unlikely [Trypanosoma brucei brucei TREU927]